MSNRYCIEVLERAGKVKQSHSEKNPCEIKPGDILLFKRNDDDRISKILSWLLLRLDGCWDRWGWHMGYVYDVLADGSIITAESKISYGVKLVNYPDTDSLGEVRVYRWADGINSSVLENFTLARLGCAYNLACYFWTGFQLIAKRFSDRLIQRIENDRYTCWELVCDMTQAMGKPLQPAESYPLITDMTKKLDDARIM